MRIHFDGNGTALVPGLLGDIAERLEALNAPYQDILEARVTLSQLGYCQEPHQETRVELLLVGRTLSATHTGATPHDAVNAALHDIARQLQAFRILRPGRRVPRQCSTLYTASSKRAHRRLTRDPGVQKRA